MARQACVCGCGRRAVHHHHVIYAQHIPPASRRDERNLVPVAFACHGAHHNRQRPLPIRCLPDSVFEFALEVLGPGPAWSYLGRYYAGDDPRMADLIAYEEADEELEEDIRVLSEAALTPEEETVDAA